MSTTLGVIGCGKMGQALLGGILQAGLAEPARVHVYDPVADATRAVADRFGVAVAESNAAVAASCETVLLCVKPQGFVAMLGELGAQEGRLLISIAAGVRLETIENAIERKHRAIRVMPNTPALVGRGASAFALGRDATEEDATLTQGLLSAVGYATRVEEPLLDAVTALSGSGPAYVFALIESLVAAATELGLSDTQALQLASHTVAGAAELQLQSGESPGQLRENVTSPNGTTFAALESLRQHGFDATIQEAVRAAHRRSVELGEA